MSETAARTHRLSRRAKALVCGVLAAAAVGGGSVAVAGSPAVFRQDNGVVAIDGQQLRPWYYGRALDAEQIEDLNDDGKAMFSNSSIETACHGVSLVFDTEAESDAYARGYTARAKAVRTKREALAPSSGAANVDNCAWWKDPIPEAPILR